MWRMFPEGRGARFRFLSLSCFSVTLSRHKHHKNCKKWSRPAPQDCRRPQLSHYKATYTQPPNVHPRSSKRPLRTPPHPNPPAMAFSTTQRAEFIPWELGQRTKPHVREAYQCPQEPFQSQSLYRLHFPPREPVMTTLRQPPTPRQPNSSGFPHTTTTTKESYKGLRVERPACYGEPPALAGALLSPDQAAEIESTMQREFTEKRIPKPELVKGAQVQLTMEGDHDMMTTHQSTYQSVPLEKRVAQSHNKGIVPAGKRAQVEYMTKYQSDFPACNLLPARLQPAQPPLDNLAINQGFSTDFQTVQRESYHGWDTRRYPHASPIKLKEELADLRKERDGKFSGDTVTKLSYPLLPLDRPPRTEWPPTVLRSLPAKFDDSTAHKFFFREWGVQPRIRQGDPYDGVYIRPLAKFESQTTTHSTFLPQIVEVVKNCKPEQKSIRAQGKQDFSTIHRESYRPIPLPVCRLQMYLIQQQQKGQETINSLVPVKA
ncbi:stabilizer of axonemal microtubules 2-like isoform X2 [Gopherus flavomarginatus]|uniref:stabilizer of axonemal microtubules 2-like isoform X2 n=1 Tax=Gopherus flavomarginatus TaxID=286002 RepID=UPI0021CBBC49|nr:stabilizer of axonemal microtubules 2-like isoform X2 [Gopherus flavomarginatus]